MTKQFCDLCGAPAHTDTFQKTVSFPDKEWSGINCKSVNPCDGRRTPKISLRIVFDAEDMSQQSYRQHTPDLCCNCAANMIRELADSLAQPPRPPEDID